MINSAYYNSTMPTRFIVIDDEEINILVSEFTIRRYNKNADTHQFTNPGLALEFIKDPVNQHGEHAKTIILLDINMPLMTGLEFLDEFGIMEMGLQKQFTIYMLSSSIDPADMERVGKYDFVSGYFLKPLSELHLNTV